MVIFHSYVSLQEGNVENSWFLVQISKRIPKNPIVCLDLAASSCRNISIPYLKEAMVKYGKMKPITINYSC